ncbi:sulfurtransferase [Olleya aquimaris]|uniref:3-mercaptopyruvate sulfurtransferase SseA n=1 Tax=Olleya aquimaris TaxID=639310 RepID=A0A327RR27_9FLAO|nr:sulfurtransferase [Olleya aquimaris]RAJ16177.1 3-mercaptopyruvate sulfurtransferase SseA [Olleya aquimaris]
MSKAIEGFGELVSVDWLKNHLNDERIIILDASLPKVTGSASKLLDKQIPKARFFDIKNTFSNTSSEFPNTIPSEIQFEQASQDLGLNNNSIIVVYDNVGMYSSPRAWWLFKTFGHQQVAVLDGGLPEWTKRGYTTENIISKPYIKGDFKATYNPNNVVYFESLDMIVQDPNFKIIDARSSDRFNGLVSEPREGLRSGTIPNSENLPFETVLNDNKFKSPDEIKVVFNQLATPNQQLVFSCGSGITACILSLAATIAGYNNSVYDGSWTEYGTLTTATMDKPNTWTKDELLAYILLFVAHSDLDETRKEKDYILSRVDKKVYQRVHERFEADNDYQSIQNIIEGVKTHDYYRNDLADLFADIKLMAFADGEMDIMENMAYILLKKILK